MSVSTLVLVLLVVTALFFYIGKRRAIGASGGDFRTLHSLPGHYGLMVAFWCGVPAFVLLLLWLALDTTIITQLVISALPEEARQLSSEQLNLLINNIRNLAEGNIAIGEPDAVTQTAVDHYQRLSAIGDKALWVLVITLGIVGAVFALRSISPKLRARNRVEAMIKVFLIISSMIAVFTTLGIVLSVLFESMLFFQKVSLAEFLFGLHWSPQTAIRSDQAGSSGAFGAIPLFVGTLLISTIAMLVAVPIGLFSAIYLSEYASPMFRMIAKPLLEILAGIPTVVYGFFAALTVAPFIRSSGSLLGLDVASESALAAGLVMGIMIIPFVSSLSDDVINAVPQAMRDGAYALGATRSETLKQVILAAALPGIVGGVLLAVSRAIGETMIVVMAAGLSANLTINPLEAVTTVTVQIVTLLVGDQEFDSAKTLAAFALGLALFIITLVLNIVALNVVKKYREQYE